MTDKVIRCCLKALGVLLGFFLTLAFFSEGMFYVSQTVECKVPTHYTLNEVINSYEPGFWSWQHTHPKIIETKDFWILPEVYRYECLTLYKNIYPIYMKQHDGLRDLWTRDHAKRMYSRFW